MGCSLSYITYDDLSSSHKSSKSNLNSNKNLCLFEKIGGEEAIKSVVNTYNELVLSNKDLSPLFYETNMTKQSEHQQRFISFALGGPNKYKGKSMREAHSHLNLTEEHFSLVAKLLTEALRKNGVNEKDICSVMKVVESTHDDILNL